MKLKHYEPEQGIQDCARDIEADEGEHGKKNSPEPILMVTQTIEANLKASMSVTPVSNVG